MGGEKCREGQWEGRGVGGGSEWGGGRRMGKGCGRSVGEWEGRGVGGGSEWGGGWGREGEWEGVEEEWEGEVSVDRFRKWILDLGWVEGEWEGRGGGKGSGEGMEGEWEGGWRVGKGSGRRGVGSGRGVGRTCYDLTHSPYSRKSVRLLPTSVRSFSSKASPCATCW